VNIDLDIFTRWFVIDLLKLVSRFGIVIVFFVAVMVLQLFRPAYSFVDILLILAVGMMMGAGYIEGQHWISKYLEKQSREE
jgi:hypothetical protein